MVRSEINAFLSIGKKIYARGMTYNKYKRWWWKNKYLGTRPRGEANPLYKRIRLDKTIKRLFGIK
jgi:hypothetical protein